MLQLLTVGFEFRDEFYYAVIRVKEKLTGTNYEITVMNGNLEKLLYGNHVIELRNGSLQIETTDASEQELLREAIADALGKFLDIPLQRSMNYELQNTN